MKQNQKCYVYWSETLNLKYIVKQTLHKFKYKTKIENNPTILSIVSIYEPLIIG